MTECELCGGTAYKVDPDMGYMLCLNDYQSFNGPISVLELPENYDA